MFAYRMGVTEIMILVYQAVKKLFLVCFSDLTELNRLELFDCGDKRCLVNIEVLRFSPLGLPTAGEWFLSGRKRNVALPVKFQHESTANSILECSVRLHPIPFTTDSQGQSSTALIRIFVDELAEKVDVVDGYGTFAVCENLEHGESLNEIDLECTFFRAINGWVNLIG